MPSSEQEVLAAAQQRAAALVGGDVGELRRLMHPQMRWTTRLGAVLDRETYIAGNTKGSLVWRAQRLETQVVTVFGKTAVLTAVVIDEVEEDGRRQTFRLRLTQTWMRSGGEWRCIFRSRRRVGLEARRPGGRTPVVECFSVI